MKKIFNLSLILVVAVALSSCLKEQADVFDKPASTRMEEALENTREILSSAQNGWWVAYYPNRALGGYVMTFEFTPQTVKARSEVFPGESQTTDFNLITDDGPVLSFDVNNKIIHYFATPSTSEYEAKGGDFEFIILSATPDSVSLKGKRNGNLIKMYPLKKSAEDYLADIADITTRMITPEVNTTIAGGMVHASLDLNYRQFTIGRKDADPEETQTVAYIQTEDGIMLYEPVTVNGTTIQYLTYKDLGGGERTLSSGDLVFKAEPIPDGYTTYDEYVGDYTASLGSYSLDVTLEEGERGRTLLMKGLNKEYSVSFGYDKNDGSLRLRMQYLCSGDTDTDDPFGLYLVPMNGGSLSTGEKDGAYSERTDENTITFRPMSFRSVSFRLLEYHPSQESKWRALKTANAKYKLGGVIDEFPIPFTVTVVKH